MTGAKLHKALHSECSILLEQKLSHALHKTQQHYYPTKIRASLPFAHSLLSLMPLSRDSLFLLILLTRNSLFPLTLVTRDCISCTAFALAAGGG